MPPPPPAPPEPPELPEWWAELPVDPADVRAALGEAAAGVLDADPWRLLDIAGVTPRQADAFARNRVVGARPDDPRRQAGLVRWLLHRAARDGHTQAPVLTVRAALPGLHLPDSDSALRVALATGEVVQRADAEGHEVLALARLAAAEEAIAGHVRRLAERARPLCQPEGVQTVAGGLDAEQAEAVRIAVAAGASIVTGGPGTGKSRTVAALVELARAVGRRILLTAPTGRAARRLAELAGAPASTLHAALGLQPGQRPHQAPTPLAADLVVIDEASMLDVELAAAVVAAVPDGANLVLVGDVAQLPSIGPGQVLADLIGSGAVPVTRLLTGHRHRAGGVIDQLATAIREGRLPRIDDPGREVVVVPARDDGEAVRRVLQLVTDSIPHRLGIPAEDIQVLTPLHRGAAGADALSRSLKEALNPGPGRFGGFDPGDRVLFTRNRPDAGWANGDVGSITGVRTRGQVDCLVVGLPDRDVEVPVPLLGDLRPAWALTVHRAQGSEWPAVVTVFPGAAAGMLTRAFVYTAVTRARAHLSVVHASGPVLSRAVAELPAPSRRTLLSTFVHANTCIADSSPRAD